MQIIREQPLDWDVIAAWIDELAEILALRHEVEIVAHIQKLVPEFTPTARLTRDQGHRTLLVNGSSLRHSSLDGTEYGRHERNQNDRDSLLRNSDPPAAREY
jgi:hypothetical protein